MKLVLGNSESINLVAIATAYSLLLRNETNPALPNTTKLISWFKIDNGLSNKPICFLLKYVSNNLGSAISD